MKRQRSNAFEQLYDLKRDEPKAEYLKMYQEAKAEFEDLGLHFHQQKEKTELIKHEVI